MYDHLPLEIQRWIATDRECIPLELDFEIRELHALPVVIEIDHAVLLDILQIPVLPEFVDTDLQSTDFRIASVRKAQKRDALLRILDLAFEMEIRLFPENIRLRAALIIGECPGLSLMINLHAIDIGELSRALLAFIAQTRLILPFSLVYAHRLAASLRYSTCGTQERGAEENAEERI